MKILFSAQNQGWDAQLDERFGRCPGFLLYDEEKDDLTWHPLDSNVEHGAGIGAGQKAVDLKADVVITNNLGPKAKQILDSAGIKQVVTSKIDTIRKLYEAYKKGELG